MFRIGLFGINAVIGLALAKFGLMILGDESYGVLVRAFIYVELSAAILGIGLPYIVERAVTTKWMEFWKYHIVIICITIIFAAASVNLLFKEIYDEYLIATIIGGIYLTVMARCVTRYMIGLKKPEISIFLQIIETKIPIMFGLIFLEITQNYQYAMMAYALSKVPLLIVPAMIKKTPKKLIKMNAAGIEFWLYDIGILMVSNSVIIYKFYFGSESDYAATWIYFVVANALATIVINGTRVSVLTKLWQGESDGQERKTEVLLMVTVTMIAILFGDQFIGWMFSIKGGHWILVGTLISWVSYSIVGPRMEDLLVNYPKSILMVVGSVFLVMVVMFKLIQYQVMPIWILFLLPLIKQIVASYVLRYNNTR